MAQFELTSEWQLAAPIEPVWQNTRMHSATDAVTEIERLKRLPGKDMMVLGGARIAQSLTAAGLVDEYRLLSHPVALASGMPLFTVAANLSLVHSTAFDTGAFAQVYRPA